MNTTDPVAFLLAVVVSILETKMRRAVQKKYTY